MVPQPLGALDGRERGPRRGAQAGGAPRRHGHRQHQRHRARRAHVRHRRGRRPARRADRRAGDDRATATSTARCPTATPPTRRSIRRPATCTPSPTTGRSRTCSTSSSAPTDWSAGRADRGRRRPDGPRLLDHRALDGRLRPARDRSTSTPRWAGPASRTAGTRAAPPGSGSCRSAASRRRRALVRGRAVLRVPPAQRVRRRRPRRARRRPLRPHVRPPSPLFPEDGPPLLWRWTLDTATGTRPRAAAVGDVPLEFPRVDERAVGRATPWAGLGRRPRRDRQRLRWSPGAHRRRHRRRPGRRPRRRPPRRGVGDGAARRRRRRTAG